ncbi:hypothetical protein [Endozoicomonas sp. GU-1]|uniref:hypothetical protein n=1 Tax=Endozoicomonas sp. GU-1 TaxID=3009078 RepID=UPI0022B463DE|nr:hypothetical protein [Endozoicomonas sp. GU-1]WBA83690.1 hypothetical protein O2T12_11500 [Endozoicomonas sp. GU-1]WBA86667.1 hypothetical protein O3276_01055 [Endozoicomonas sp. GU-1]
MLLDRPFRCDNGQCIDIGRDKLCDGSWECNDGSDEDCTQNTCRRLGRFICGDDTCIPAVWQCDGTKDCKDNSDERAQLCNRNSTQTTPLVQTTTTGPNTTLAQATMPSPTMPVANTTDIELESSAGWSAYTTATQTPMPGQTPTPGPNTTLAQATMPSPTMPVANTTDIELESSAGWSAFTTATQTPMPGQTPTPGPNTTLAQATMPSPTMPVANTTDIELESSAGWSAFTTATQTPMAGQTPTPGPNTTLAQATMPSPTMPVANTTNIELESSADSSNELSAYAWYAIPAVLTVGAATYGLCAYASYRAIKQTNPALSTGQALSQSLRHPLSFQRTQYQPAALADLPTGSGRTPEVLEMHTLV